MEVSSFDVQFLEMSAQKVRRLQFNFDLSYTEYMRPTLNTLNGGHINCEAHYVSHNVERSREFLPVRALRRTHGVVDG